MYKTYVINRDQDVARWNKVQQEFEKQNILNIERISAEQYSFTNLPKDFLEFDKEQIRNLLVPQKFWNLAALGCWKSHYNLWQTITEPSFIFEDDIIFNPNIKFMNEIQKIIKEVKKYDVIFFYPNKKYTAIAEPSFKNCRKITSPLFTTFGYLIHPNFIKKFPNLKPCFPFDIQMQYLLQGKNHDIFISKYNLIFTDCSSKRESTIKNTQQIVKNNIKNYEMNEKYLNNLPNFVKNLSIYEFSLYLEDEKILKLEMQTKDKTQVKIICRTREELSKFID
jgi:GR25 family glycosyltransferase involved in LPS biosynthesis